MTTSESRIVEGLKEAVQLVDRATEIARLIDEGANDSSMVVAHRILDRLGMLKLYEPKL